MLLLFLLGEVVVLAAWRQVRWPDSWSRYLSFGAVLLLVCAISRLFYIADYFVNGLQYDQWPFFAQRPEAAVFKGEALAVVGTLLTLFGWRVCGGMKISPAVVMEHPQRTFRIMLVIYVASLFGMLVASQVPRAAGAFGQLLPALLALGLVSTFLLPMARLRTDTTRLIAVVVLSVPFAALASHSGMKQNIILAIVPSAVMAWRRFRHPAVRMGMVVAGLLALALITSYVRLYRAEVWQRESMGLPVSANVPQDFVKEIQTDGIARTLGAGLSDFIQRADASYRQGWAVSIADEQAFHPELVLAPLTYVFVPRMLWPAKPRNLQGAEYTALVTGARFAPGGSSTAVGLYPGLYLGYGWPAFLAGALFAGILLAGMTRVVLRLGGPFAAGLYIFAMLPFMLRMGENWPVDDLSLPIINAVYVIVIVASARVVARIAIRTRYGPATAP